MKRDPETELAALALRLASVRDPRPLAFEIVALLLSVLRQTLPSLRYGDALARLLPLFDAATDAVAAPMSTRAEQMADVRVTADRAASNFCACCNERGAWPLEFQIPYDIATAIRRTCEPNMARMLPLVVRDARALLHHAMAGPERIDALLVAAGATPPKERPEHAEVEHDDHAERNRDGRGDHGVPEGQALRGEGLRVLRGGSRRSE